MSCIRLVQVAAVLLICLIGATPATAAGPRCKDAELMPSAANLPKIRAATLCLLNVERRKRGRRAVRDHAQLRKVAQRHSRLMVRKRFFSHVGRDGSTVTSRVKRRSRYLRRAHSWTLGENLGWGAGERATPRSQVRDWMRSSPHRRVMLDRRFRHVGIGVSLGAHGEQAATYTANFGRRAYR